MHAGKGYRLLEFLTWTRRDLYVIVLISSIPVCCHQLLGWAWLAIPWLPVATIGTAVAFLIGFKNNATYARAWEARQIWGGIVNSSRSFGMMVRDYIIGTSPNADVRDVRPFIQRHRAWLTALRYQLREPRVWETASADYNVEYRRNFIVPEWNAPLEEVLRPLLTDGEFQRVLASSNRATAILALQSEALRTLLHNNIIDTYQLISLEEHLALLVAEQGKCERIKNFPYPRQFASVNQYFIRIFILLVPFGMIQAFADLVHHTVWMSIPFSVIVSWIFYSMEKIGESTENPFEGGANDIPMFALSRGIEIDLMQMIGEDHVPEPARPVNHILM